MNKPNRDPLDQLFESLAEARFETPPTSFLQDVEARLEAQQKKQPKPLAFWWVWSVFGAIICLGIFVYKSTTPKETLNSQSNAPKVAVKTWKKKSSKPSNAAAALKIKTPSHHLNSYQATKLWPSPTLTPQSRNLFQIETQYHMKTDSIFNIATDSTHKVKALAIHENPIEINPADTSELIQIEHQISTPPATTSALNTPLPKITNHAFGLQFGVSTIYSSFSVPDILNNIPGYSAKDYREIRRIGERQTTSWDFNFRYQYTNGLWQFQAGLQYLEWGEQLQYDVISVEGINRYKYVQVPLLAGFRLVDRKVGISPMVGVAFASGLTTNGTYIQPLNNGVTLVYAKAQNWNALAQIELSYNINSKITFTLTPSYRQTLGWLIEDELIKNRYSSIGLLTGFFFKL